MAAILAVLGWTVVPATALALGWFAHVIVASEPGSVDPDLLKVRIVGLQRELVREARGDLASAVADLDVWNVTLARDSLNEARRKLEVAQRGDPGRPIPERAVVGEALELVASDSPADWQAAREKLAGAVGIEPAVEPAVESAPEDQAMGSGPLPTDPF